MLQSGGRLPADYERVREIIRLAAKQVKNPSTKAWFLADERGTWEKTVGDYLSNTADKARELGMSTAQVNQEIADRICYLALAAAIENAEKRGKKRR